MSASLHARASAAGLCRHWEDAAGIGRTVADADLHAILAAMDAAQGDAALDPPGLPPLVTAEASGPVHLAGVEAGLLTLIHEDGEEVEMAVDGRGMARAPARPGDWRFRRAGASHSLAVAPPRCYSVADALDLPAPRAWGVGVQVYSTRQTDDGGVGDAAGVLDWVYRVAAAGGDAVALSPVHAARPCTGVCSPYSPSDRRRFDPVHAAPALVLGADVVAAACGHVATAPAGDDALIDWPAATAARWRRLRALYAARGHLAEGLRADLAEFEMAGGDALEAFARHAARDHGDGEPGFHRFAQWLAERSWAGVQRAARDRGMGLGLIADIAVGFDPAGAEAAAWPDAVLQGLELGAPPDAFNAAGQVWGVTGYSAAGLRRTGYAPFRALLRATMHARGGVRIDHILGLMRLWVVPRGAPSSAGAYLQYPLQDLLNLVALESWRQRCIVIGEDLGVVPPGLRDTLARRGVLGIDVLPFTRDAEGAFLPPKRWRRDAIATTTTHDLPTLAGWAQGRDLEWRARIDAVPGDVLQTQREARADDVAALDAACLDAIGATGPVAWAAYAAASPAPLALLPVEDALGLEEQPNLPGTVDEHPNWRRRLPTAVDDTPALAARLRAFAAARNLDA
ncbi:4-alpha-glucanotransferase [Luteimonas deserti]|uniref:4-alpha-glucanotransferase n=1 Tax=Luteimonas deserti TaxID=2752306 RepID=A0A7Z0QQV5_9GAMM|nr:4-alpha-glucanotransferase [Luteimonas deserti]NYZ62055.1 4-alpha-glucanotransferase [Luteimonas deserti]